MIYWANEGRGGERKKGKDISLAGRDNNIALFHRVTWPKCPCRPRPPAAAPLGMSLSSQCLLIQYCCVSILFLLLLLLLQHVHYNWQLSYCPSSQQKRGRWGGWMTGKRAFWKPLEMTRVCFIPKLLFGISVPLLPLPPSLFERPTTR